MTSLTTRFTAALLAAALLPGASSAQEPSDTFRLDPLVVTATRLPTPRHAVPAAVTVIGGDALRALGAHRLVDALRTVAGVHLASSGPEGSFTSLFLRGGEADYVRVLIDGVPLNEPGGAYDFGHLATHDVERIEIVRGPASVLYGSDAVAGVVQIFTRDGRGSTPHVHAALEGGTFEKRSTGPAGEAASGYGRSLNAEAGVSGAFGALGYAFGAARTGTDGLLAVNNDYERTSGSARLRWVAPREMAGGPGARSDAALTLRLTDHRYHFPTDGAGRVVDLDQNSGALSTAIALEGGHFLAPRVEARAALRLHRRTADFEDRPDEPGDTLGFYASESEDYTRRAVAEASANVHFAQGVLTLGGAAEWQAGRTHLLSLSEFGPFESDAEHARRSRAGYAQLVARPVDPLTLTLGGRLDHSETFGGFATYRVGANVEVAPGTTLRAALGTAFKEPTFFENFAEGFVRGNPALDPERSRTREVGAMRAIGAGSLTVTLFDQRFRDMIQYDPRPAGERPGEANYFNLAEARARGVEAELQLRPIQRLDLRAGWTLLDTEVLDAGAGGDRAFTAGASLLRRPEHAGSVVAALTLTPRLGASLAWSYTGARDDLDFAADWQGEGVRLDAHSTVDVGLRLDVGTVGALGPVGLTARVRNLLDARYEEIRGFPAGGRGMYLGVRAGAGR
jgi:vitamin B12 transporter